jgi:hypothetical protein
MKAAHRLVAPGLALAILLSVQAPTKASGLIVYDNHFTAVTRATGVSPYPLTVDASGAVYLITGTSPADALLKVGVNGSIDTVNPAVNAIIGTTASLRFGFGGQLFANQDGGIRQFDPVSGAASTFWSNPQASADGALAFDAARQVMYVSDMVNGVQGIYALSASAAVTPIFAHLGGYLAVEKSGDILLFDSSGDLSRIDPVTHTHTDIANFAPIIPNWRRFKSMSLDPNSGEVYFTVELNESPTARDLYRVGVDGTGLTLVAAGGAAAGVDGPLQVMVGSSGDGSGRTSVYLGMNESQELIELRPAASAPEPNSFPLFGLCAICLLTYASRCRV